MKLKRFFAAALADTLLALSLTACGGNTNADTNTDASRRHRRQHRRDHHRETGRGRFHLRRSVGPR